MEQTKQKPDGKIRLKQSIGAGNPINCVKNIDSPADIVQQKLPPTVQQFIKCLSMLVESDKYTSKIELELRVLLHTAPFRKIAGGRVCQ